ncbi:hypothetical protein UFOVP331_168 [uncultured Caudovirales phage]|uniref:Uncharacterized protein n=1 Tax=uncultured Caudovirales phage TaxID=2100421 RepID=A0A6J5LVQ9_9CAUD|nr:hypothetical protein UFOVP331_168 [uncultured Caudovirales phage]
MAEIVNIQSLDAVTFELQTYTLNDINLIPIIDTFGNFDSTTDHIEYFIYDLNDNILFSNVIGYSQFSLLNNNLFIDPEANLKDQGYTEGNYNTLYNFLRNRAGSSPLNRYYIDEISSDRTEVRLNTTAIPNSEVIISVGDFISYRDSSSVFVDFYLDFGDNNLIIANNILLDINTNPDDPTVLIKLYEPLPDNFDIQSQCWIVESIAEPVAYNISIIQTFDELDQNIYLRGPNTNIAIKDQINNSTPYVTYNSLTSNTSVSGTGSLQYQINSILAEKGLEINIDYSDYSEFVFFSSAKTRLENFYYKLSLIDQYQSNANLITSTTNSFIINSSNIWTNKIDEIITGFDGYEYYLYYESGSTAWPKTNSTYPYINSLPNSVNGLAFLASQSIVAENYDSQNNNRLINAIPSYLTDDSTNEQYMLFVDMVGQNFDSVWVYIKDVTNKYNADNRVDYGVSKDLVADVLRDLGIKIYQNNFSTDDLYSALLGITPSGSLYNLPFTIGSLPVPTGSFLDYINTYVTASSTGSLDPTFDINAETYKRIYHNLPYILKKKGTPEGLRALITSYGIPDTILRINEFGGKDKNTNTWDYWQDEYNYAYNYTSSTPTAPAVVTNFQLNSNWNSITNNNRPTTLQFRFKVANAEDIFTNTKTTLWHLDNGIDKPCVVLNYTGSGLTSGSYAGSIPDPYNQYAELKFIGPSFPTPAPTLYLPFLNEDWWSVTLTVTSTTATIYAGNIQYDGYDGNKLGYYASSSSTYSPGDFPGWTSAFTSSFLPSASTYNSIQYKPLSGSLQEIRYYGNLVLNESSIKDYIMNPYSIEGNGVGNGYDNLAFRLPLGGELYTGSTSVHPKITGSWTTTSSFVSTSTASINLTNGKFVPNKETFFYDQVAAGIQNAVSEKIQNKNIVLPYTGSDSNIPDNKVLSPFISVQQQPSISGSYTNNVDYVEVAFSPQNEINDDINDTFGYFNMGEYIGDPRYIPSRNTSYTDLNILRDKYFEKYTSNYNIWDYVRLIKFFDNSLFKMIQDFVPAHTDLASGVVIKQHLLERNRYPTPQINLYTTQSVYGSGSTPVWNSPNVFEDITITGSIRGIPGMLDGQRIFTSSTDYESFPIEQATGSSGGVMPEFNGTASTDLYVNITQSWSGTTPSLVGNVAFTQSNQDEFFNGELSGSVITVSNGNLTDPDCEIYLNANTIETKYKPIFYKSTQLLGSDNSLNIFLNPNTAPNPGEIYLYWDSGSFNSQTFGTAYLPNNNTQQTQ